MPLGNAGTLLEQPARAVFD